VRKKILLFACLVIATCLVKAQTYKDKTVPIEDRVNSLLKEITLDEKLDYIGGYTFLDIRPIARLGLPHILISDGPVGVNEYGPETAYPCGILDAATWDTSLVKQLGVALGRDARARGVHVLLAPGVNIYRAPMCGRNFEYFGEDPYLTSRMAVSYIEGVQSQNVVATVKHFAANNQEWDRHNISSDIDERTLQEIYLPAFKAAVQEAKVGAVMDSYNLINSTHATQNRQLNIDILKNSWGFDGILMSDWNATYDGTAAAENGLDLEMPFARFMNKANLIPAINGGGLSATTIDDKARRILRIIFRFGFYDWPQQDTSLPKDDPKNVQTALQVAREGIILLKNENKLLPLINKVKNIVVIGPNAENYIGGAGSSEVYPFHVTDLLTGLEQNKGKQVKITYVPVLSTLEGYCKRSVFYTTPGSTQRGLKAEYFKGGVVKEKPDSTGIEQYIIRKNDDLRQKHQLPDGPFIARWTGVIRPQRSGIYCFTVTRDESISLHIGDKIVTNFKDGDEVYSYTATMHLDSGKEYSIKLQYTCKDRPGHIAFAWYPKVPDFSEAFKAAKSADAVILSMGFNGGLEHEGDDRAFELPNYQDSLIKTISQINAQTVVVLNAGGNVYMQKWINAVPALLMAWYPGQEGGTAIAETLFGKINPSGKLPASFEKEWKGAPTYHSYYDEQHTGHVQYKEGLFIGYRYWDTTKLQPQFPFGYGLSYTSFKYSNLTLNKTGKNTVTATFQLKNTGDRDGADVAELYVHQQYCDVVRPIKELKGFAKVFLKKGESKTVSIQLDSNAFSYYKEQQKAFEYDPGMFDIIVGASSKDIRLTKSIKIN
jgi:beta-glucosidase